MSDSSKEVAVRVLRLVVLLSMGCNPLRAEISVEILNAPASVYSTEPLYILYQIANQGSEAVLLPAEYGSGRGVEFRSSRGSAPFRRIDRAIPEFDTPHAVASMWLAPGERWLGYQDVSSGLGGLEGDIEVQVVLSGSGRCGDRIVGGKKTFALAPLFVESISKGAKTFQSYRCWEGEVLSPPRVVRMLHPDSVVDQEAEAALRREGKVLEDQASGNWSVTRAWDLYKRYPASHFAYGSLAGATASLSNKLRAIELQPENPQNSWVRGAIAMMVLEARSTCWKGPPAPSDISLAQMELPNGVREFLDQYAWFLENRRCVAESAASR